MNANLPIEVVYYCGVIGLLLLAVMLTPIDSFIKYIKENVKDPSKIQMTPTPTQGEE
jgi:hypothetical protein